jgi:hypothetical protein
VAAHLEHAESSGDNPRKMSEHEISNAARLYVKATP